MLSLIYLFLLFSFLAFFSLDIFLLLLFAALSVVVCHLRDTFVKKEEVVLKSLSLCNKVLSFVCSWVGVI